jgi:hypothetical protein
VLTSCRKESGVEEGARKVLEVWGGKGRVARLIESMMEGEGKKRTLKLGCTLFFSFFVF